MPFSKVTNRTSCASGMTLVEVIIVVSFFTILMLVITDTINSLYKSNENIISQAYQIESAQRGTEVLIRDLREMTFADNGAFPLVVMEPNKIGFYSDIDRDDSVEYVEFEHVASTTLIKKIYNATGTPLTYGTTSDETIILSEYVQNLTQGTSTFYYFDQNGNPTTASTTVVDVRYVQAQIIVDVVPGRPPGEFILRSSAALRNLNENL